MTEPSLMPSAEQYPFSYSPEEVPDIQPLTILNRPDTEGRLARWAKNIADGSSGRPHRTGRPGSLDVRDRAQAVVLAYETGLVTTGDTG